MYSFFLYILIVILVISMVNYTKKRMNLKKGKKLRSRQLRNKVKRNKLKKVTYFIERFGLLGNDLEMEGDDHEIERGLEWVKGHGVRVDPVGGDVIEG